MLLRLALTLSTILASAQTHAAIMSPERVVHTYCIPLGGRPGFDRVNVLVMDYVWNTFGFDPQQLMMGWTLGCGPHGGATFRVTDRVAEQLRPFLKKSGYEMVSHGLWYDRELLTTSENQEVFHAGNEILIKYAKRLIAPFETETPEQIALQLESEFLTWSEVPQGTKEGLANVTDILPYEYGLAPLQVELRRLINGARFLSRINTDVLDKQLEREIKAIRPIASGAQVARQRGIDLPPELENKISQWTLQDWEKLKQKSPELETSIRMVQEMLARYERLSPAQRDQEARLSLAEKLMLGWISAMDPSDDFNAETSEFFAHGFLMSLGTIESDYNELDQPLVVEAEVADILNRYLVVSKWIATHEPFGDQRRQLVQKLASYKGLIPYLNVLLAAKIGIDQNRPPSLWIQSEYKKLKTTLSFSPPWWGGRSIQPKAHSGPLYRANGEYSSANVIQGLKFIDGWFTQHNLPTEDWTKLKGIPPDVQRSWFEEQRLLSLCEQSLKYAAIRRF